MVSSYTTQAVLKRFLVKCWAYFEKGENLKDILEYVKKKTFELHSKIWIKKVLRVVTRDLFDSCDQLILAFQ